MRRTVLPAAVLALTLAACSSSTSKPASPGTASTTSPGAVAAAATPAAGAAKHAVLGTPQTLKFTGGTATMTVLTVVDPAKPTQGSEKAGIRDAAVQIRIVGNGPAVFTSGAMITLQGFDAAGQRLQKHLAWPTSAGPELDALTGVTVAAGDTEQGFVVFEVPDGAKVARLQYTPPGGAMVEWALS